jgi:hypothetical protein
MEDLLVVPGSSRVYFAAPAEWFGPSFGTKYLLGLVHCIEIPLAGSHVVTIVRCRSVATPFIPLRQLFADLRQRSGLQPDSLFNLVYQRFGTNGDLDQTIHLVGCTDDLATVSLRVTMDGEYEVASFPFHHSQVDTSKRVI